MNKNLIPFDKRGPFQTSGLRLGTPAVTSRGMGVAEMRAIAGMIAQVITARGAEAAVGEAAKQVAGLVRKFPLYKSLLKEFGS